MWLQFLNKSPPLKKKRYTVCLHFDLFPFAAVLSAVLFLRLVQKLCVTKPHTNCYKYSVAVKNVIYSYLFISEKPNGGNRSRLKSLSLLLHTKRNRPKQTFVVLNRLEFSEWENSFEWIKTWVWKQTVTFPVCSKKRGSGYVFTTDCLMWLHLSLKRKSVHKSHIWNIVFLYF